MANQRVWKFENQNFEILRKTIEQQFEWTDISDEIQLIDQATLRPGISPLIFGSTNQQNQV